MRGILAYKSQKLNIMGLSIWINLQLVN